MQIPGHIDPVPVPRAITPREDGRVDLLGLSREQIRAELEGAGLDTKQAKLRARFVTFLHVFPPLDEAWLVLLKDQVQRGIRHRLALAAWTALDGTAGGAAHDGLAELVLQIPAAGDVHDHAALEHLCQARLYSESRFFSHPLQYRERGALDAPSITVSIPESF